MRKPVTQILFCFLIAVSISATAQEQFVDGPAKLLTSFRFKQLSGGVIMLNAGFANFPDTLNFILDTGSGGISLDSTTVDYFHITPTPSNLTILGIAGIRKVSFMRIHIEITFQTKGKKKVPSIRALGEKLFVLTKKLYIKMLF